jgi:hypothetical protein
MLLEMLHAIGQNVAVSICLVLALGALLGIDWELRHIRAEMKRKAKQVRIDKDRWLDTCRKKIDPDSKGGES